MADNGDPGLRCPVLAAWVRHQVKDAVNRQHPIHPILQPDLLICRAPHQDGKGGLRRAGQEDLHRAGREDPHRAARRHQRGPPQVDLRHLPCPHSLAWRRRARMHRFRLVTRTQITSTRLPHPTRPIRSSPICPPHTTSRWQNGTTYQQLTQLYRTSLQTPNPSPPCLLNFASSHRAAPALRRPLAPR